MFSPRSSNYERLEGGMGPSKSGPGRKFSWKKFAIGAAVIIGLVYFFNPRREDLDDYMPSIIRLEGDPDLPLVQFALMIDAGSTGSRIHIYKFNNCGPSPGYEYEVFKQRQPGLSDYRYAPSAVTERLDALLDEAIKLRATIHATSSASPIRLEDSSTKDSISAHYHSRKTVFTTAAVRHRIEDKYPFSQQGGADSVVIMDGRDQGVYAWISANYRLDTIRSSLPAGTEPYAVLDLGGASTQIVFEPTFKMAKPHATLKEGEHKYDLAFGGRTRVVEFMNGLLGKSHGKDAIVPNPCLAKGTERRVEIEDERLGKKYNVTMVGADIGNYEVCNRVVELVMAKDAICAVKLCSFNGVYQPSLLETFPHSKILLLSYFYDRLGPFLAATAHPLTPPLHVGTFAELAQTVCEGPAAWRARWGADRALPLTPGPDSPHPRPLLSPFSLTPSSCSRSATPASEARLRTPPQPSPSLPIPNTALAVDPPPTSDSTRRATLSTSALGVGDTPFDARPPTSPSPLALLAHAILDFAPPSRLCCAIIATCFELDIEGFVFQRSALNLHDFQ
ncbi:hypothetical protein VTO73DRAFT_13152 [Trametes versicolor]